MASFVWGFSFPVPAPAHPSVFCLLEAKSSTSASRWRTAGVLCSCPQHRLLHPVHPFLAVFLAHLHLILVTPGHSSSLPTPFPGLCCAVSGVSALDSGILGTSPPQPQGCALALSGAAMTVLQPYLCMGCRVRGPELRPLAQSEPRAGCGCSPGVLPPGSLPWELHQQGNQGQQEFFWAFFLPFLMPRMSGLQQ